MTGSDWDERSKQQECSFLKKRTKKLLDSCARAGRKTRPNNQKFFASFFQKRSAFFMQPCSATEATRSQPAPG
jgi:hypothetical protein